MAVRGQENLFGPFFALPTPLMFAQAHPTLHNSPVGKPHFGACNPEWSGARPSARLLRMPEVTASGRLQIKMLSVDQHLPLLIHAHTYPHLLPGRWDKKEIKQVHK